MPVSTFQESDLLFSFSSEWYVKKYDAHPFYLSISGEGLRAVDFIGLHPNGDWWLMEVKNYRNRPINQQANIQKKLSDDLPLLYQLVQQKITDTQRGIQAIAAYLQRKWWYRWRYKLLNRYGSQQMLLQQDRMFWMKAAETMKQTNKGQIVLWLDLPERLQVVELTAEQKAQIGHSFQIANQKQLPNFVESVAFKQSTQ